MHKLAFNITLDSITLIHKHLLRRAQDAVLICYIIHQYNTLTEQNLSMLRYHSDKQLT